MPPGYHLKLLPEEVMPGGVFERLHGWLDSHIAAYGFYRPFRNDRGGMYPARWHLSHAAGARRALASLDVGLLRKVIGEADMAGRVLVLGMLPELYARYVLNVDDDGAL